MAPPKGTNQLYIIGVCFTVRVMYAVASGSKPLSFFFYFFIFYFDKNFNLNSHTYILGNLNTHTHIYFGDLRD
jgi:hypothetical protein